MAYATPDGGVLAFHETTPTLSKSGGIAEYFKGVAGKEPPTMSIPLNDALIQKFQVATDAKNPPRV